MKATESTDLAIQGAFRRFSVQLVVLLFVSANILQVHIAQEHESSLSSLSLITNDNTESWNYVVCKICTLKFQIEADMEHHALRVHEYGECCELYPCDKCGFRGTDIDAIQSHIENVHGSSEQTTNDIAL